MDIDEAEDEPNSRSSMSAIKSLFSFTSLQSPAVKKLLGWKQGDEEEKWAEKAVEALFKKLKKNKGAYEDLIQALKYPGQPSKCVTIQRSLDGRLQVSHRKGLPHVIYCRVWRWPDLQSHHELKPVEHCLYPFSAKQKDVCINPYHYVRIRVPMLPPVAAPNFKDFPPPMMDYQSQQNAMLDYQHVQQNVMMDYHQNSSKPNMFNNNTNSYCGNSNNMSNPFDLSSGYNLPSPGSSGPSSPYHGLSDASLGGSSPFPYSPAPLSPDSDVGSDVDFSSQSLPNLCTVPFKEQPNWASVVYFELNSRVGEVFYCKENRIVIDGFTHPSKKRNRFCLGLLTNVNRNSTIENTRMHIGKGVELEYINGKVSARNVSHSSIFINSILFNHGKGFHPNTVCKVPSGFHIDIFDVHQFANVINSRIESGYKAVHELHKMCTIRLSFVKGWGSEYHRQDVTMTPCWIEINIHDALKWLDNIVQKMASPIDQITSVS